MKIHFYEVFPPLLRGEEQQIIETVSRGRQGENADIEIVPPRAEQNIVT
jgi:hypothetical protein